MKLTHRQLEMFDAVMRSGQVTRAAERLHTSQPTLSRELLRLEQGLGFALFDRVRGRLQPTARALALHGEVAAALAGLQRVADSAQALARHGAGPLQLACLPALTQALLPAALARLDAAALDGGVTLSPLESPGLEAALAEQRYDLGLTERQEPPPATRLHRVLVADEVAVLPVGHALAGRARLSAGDFAGECFISLAATDPYRLQIDQWFASAGVARRMRLETASAASVCALVRAGLGVAIVNPLTALAMAEGQGGLLLRPLALAIPFQVSAVLPELRGQHPLQAPLLAALVNEGRSVLERLADCLEGTG